jgi:hypothetical protein
LESRLSRLGALCFRYFKNIVSCFLVDFAVICFLYVVYTRTTLVAGEGGEGGGVEERERALRCCFL